MARPYVKLYKDGDNMGVETNVSDEREFFDLLSQKLGQLIDDDRFKGDWEFQLMGWLPKAFEIVAKIRGYKSDVVEERVLYAGAAFPTDELLVSERAEMPAEGKLVN